jgi:hypothetical protein
MNDSSSTSIRTINVQTFSFCQIFLPFLKIIEAYSVTRCVLSPGYSNGHLHWSPVTEWERKIRDNKLSSKERWWDPEQGKWILQHEENGQNEAMKIERLLRKEERTACQAEVYARNLKLKWEKKHQTWRAWKLGGGQGGSEWTMGWKENLDAS